MAAPSATPPRNILLALLPPLLLALIAWKIYLLSAPATLVLMDGVELSLAEHFLGTPHPSCYPLDMQWAKAWDLLPFGTIAARAGWAAAAASVLALVVFYLVLRRAGLGKAGAALSLLSLSVAGLYWDQAVTAEVYSLHFVMLGVLLLAVLPERGSAGPISARAFLAALYLLGLTLSNHHSTLLAIPPMGLYLLWRARAKGFGLKHRLLGLLLFIMGLSVYLYLPVRAEAGSPVLHGETNRWPGFVDVVLKRVTSSSKDLTQNKAENFVIHCQRLASLLPAQGTMVQGGLVILGIFLALRKRPAEALTLGAVGSMLTLGAMWAFYSRTRDIAYLVDPFLTPAVIFGALLSGWGWDWVFKRKSFIVRMVALGVCGLTVLFLMVANLYGTTHREDRLAREWCWNALSDLPKGSMLLCSVDEYFPLLYCQMAEGLREDVKVVHRISLEEDPTGWWRSLPTDTRVHYGLQAQAPRGEETTLYHRAIEAYWAGAPSPRPFFISRFAPAFIPPEATPLLHGLTYELARGTPPLPSAGEVLARWGRFLLDSATDPRVFKGEERGQFERLYVVAANNTASYLVQALGDKGDAKRLLELSEAFEPGNAGAQGVRKLVGGE